MYSISDSDLKCSVPAGRTRKARAGRIYFSEAKVRVNYIEKIVRKKTSQFIPVSGPDLVVLEESWTGLLLAITKFGNRHIMKSIKYRLREAESNELEQGEIS
jgi:hypothetical protein